MAIQISGTTVIDNNRDITNIDTICGNSAAGSWVATQAEAEAGTDNTQVMTPLRVTQAIAAAGGGMKDDDIVWSGCNVGCAVRGGGNVFRKTTGLIWIVAPSTVQAQCSTWPMGYCGGDSGDTPNKAQRITGRSGWFIPDIGMLQCGYACRTYWDSFTGANYWSSTEADQYRAYVVYFLTGTTLSCTKCGLRCVRPFRVVCY
jgi:hypothetical protein